MTVDTVDPYLSYIRGDRWRKHREGRIIPGDEDVVPDIDKLLEDMDKSLETYKKIAEDMNIHFPDENSWLDMAHLADNIFAFLKYYYNNDEKREKFLPILRGIDKVFEQLNSALDQHFDSASYTVSRLDFQTTIQDISDRLSRRLQIQMSEDVSPRTNMEFKEACEIDKFGPKEALELLRGRVVAIDGLVQKAIDAMGDKKLVLQYWTAVLSNTCRILKDAHIQYRKVSAAPDDVILDDKKKMQEYIDEIKQHLEELGK